MKVLLIGKHNMLYWLEHAKEAFAATPGVEVKALEVNHLGLFGDMLRNITKLFSRHGASVVVRDAIAKNIRAFQPDLILVVSPFLLDATIFEGFEAAPGHTVKAGWVGDLFGAAHLAHAGAFDLLFGTDSSFIDRARELGFPEMRYLPLAVNERLFHNRGAVRSNEVLFIGAPTPERIATLNRIENVPVRVVGKGWRNRVAPHVGCSEGHIGIAEVAEAYNGADYILNVKHEHNVLNGLNMRSFEAPACGACLLQDYVKDVERNFDMEEELVVYRSVEELNEKLSVLQKDKSTYDKIRRNGYARVMAEHTYRHRIQTMLREIS